MAKRRTNRRFLLQDPGYCDLPRRLKEAEPKNSPEKEALGLEVDQRWAAAEAAMDAAVAQAAKIASKH